MIFSLKRFNDCGKCSYGTLRETFDTEKDLIFLEEKKIEIKSLEDLFKFLWRIPGISYRDKESGKSAAHFYGKHDAWWKDYYEGFYDKALGDIYITEHNYQRYEIEDKIRKDNE